MLIYLPSKRFKWTCLDWKIRQLPLYTEWKFAPMIRRSAAMLVSGRPGLIRYAGRRAV